MDNTAVHLIINPTAGGGRAGSLVEKIAAGAKSKFGPTTTVCVTTRPGEATRSTRAAVERGSTLVLVAGGDGTIQEAVNGFFERGAPVSPECELGVVNCGTGRGFAESVGLARTIEEQLDRIAEGGSRRLDVGRVRYVDTEGRPAERLFVNECQVGIGGAVVRSVGRGHKQLGGTLGFGAAAVWELVRFHCPQMRVRLDGGEEISGRFLGVMVGNGPLCGGGMRLTPEARPDDGILDVVLVRSMSVPTRLRVFPRIYRGEHTRVGQVSSHRCRRMEVDSEARPALEADGELLGSLPCTVDLLSAALRVRGTGRTGDA